jgi:hypothetical protein
MQKMVPGQPACACPCAGVFPSGQQPHLVVAQEPPEGASAMLLNAETKITVKLGTGHKVSTTPGWRVAPDFLKKFNTPHKRKGTISSPIQILLKYFVPHILY